jgi:hypothetical protein
METTGRGRGRGRREKISHDGRPSHVTPAVTLLMMSDAKGLARRVRAGLVGVMGAALRDGEGEGRARHKMT